jgi:hypothetical protein
MAPAVNAKPGGVDSKRAVLEFFVRNPDTSDTAEGVARWRLLDQVVVRALDETESILEDLVALGYLEEIDTPGVQRLYRIRRDAVEKATEYIRRLDGAKS